MKLRERLSAENLFSASLRDKCLCGLSAVHHPGDAETIGEHTETCGPKRFLKWHLDCAAFGECIEDALAFRNGWSANGNRETLRLGEMLRRRVGAHKDRAGDFHARVNNFGTPLWGNLIGHGRIGMRGHHGDFSVECFLVKLKCDFAGAVVQKVRIDVHGVLHRPVCISNTKPVAAKDSLQT